VRSNKVEPGLDFQPQPPVLADANICHTRWFPGTVGAEVIPLPAGTEVIQTFFSNLARWFEYIASFVAVCTVAYGGLRHAAAHTAHAQADAWRIIAAGIGGLVVALMAPTLVAIVRGLIPS
jgi:hypothetical protein